MTITRVKIDLNMGSVELEGEETFVSTQLDKLMPILHVSKRSPADDRMANDAGDDSEAEPDLASEVTAKKRRKGAAPPKGASCRARILELKKDGFFKNQRSPNDIVAGLKAKGWTHANNQVSASLITMFNKGEVQRTGADGKFMYYWDRSS